MKCFPYFYCVTRKTFGEPCMEYLNISEKPNKLYSRTTKKKKLDNFNWLRITQETQTCFENCGTSRKRLTTSENVQSLRLFFAELRIQKLTETVIT